MDKKKVRDLPTIIQGLNMEHFVRLLNYKLKLIFLTYTSYVVKVEFNN